MNLIVLDQSQKISINLCLALSTCSYQYEAFCNPLLMSVGYIVMSKFQFLIYWQVMIPIFFLGQSYQRLINFIRLLNTPTLALLILLYIWFILYCCFLFFLTFYFILECSFKTFLLEYSRLTHCCDSFRQTAKGLSNTYTCIHSPPKEKAMATHSSTLAWRIPRTEEPGRLQSMRSLGVGHD